VDKEAVDLLTDEMVSLSEGLLVGEYRAVWLNVS